MNFIADWAFRTQPATESFLPGRPKLQNAAVTGTSGHTSTRRPDSTHCRPRVGCNLNYSFGAPFALGPPSSAEPANTLLPLGNFTDRELQVLVPSLARKPSTVTTSPALRVFVFQP